MCVGVNTKRGQRGTISRTEANRPLMNRFNDNTNISNKSMNDPGRIYGSNYDFWMRIEFVSELLHDEKLIVVFD